MTRPPAVYRGNPFVIEAGLAYGKGPDQTATPEAPAVPAELQRANLKTSAPSPSGGGCLRFVSNYRVVLAWRGDHGPVDGRGTAGPGDAAGGGRR